MLSQLSMIYRLLNTRQRIQVVLLFILTTFVAVFELVGVASILPFMAVLSAPQTIETNAAINFVYEFLGFQSTDSFLVFLGSVTFALIVMGNVAKAFSSWASTRFSGRWGHSISMRLFRQYIHQPYPFFLQRNSSEIRKTILGEVQILISSYLIPILDVLSRSLLCLAVAGLLFLADPVLAASTISVLGGAYVLIYVTIRRWLSRIGMARANAQTQRHKVINEALQGIKNVKLAGQEELYLRLFEGPSKLQMQATALAGMASDMPRYALESLAFGGLMLVVLIKLAQSSDLQDTLPILTLYAVAGYRLMPNFQAIFSSITKIRFNSVVLSHISNELSNTVDHAPSPLRSRDPVRPMPFQREIKLTEVGFVYVGSEKCVLDRVTLTIKANSFVGIVGRSGVGKTTLVDILIGLLRPTVGQMEVDGIALDAYNLRSWQRNIAYVSQHIYLSDDTIRRNIAFGLAEEDIDDERVDAAIRMAALQEYVEALPLGSRTPVGENGARLSGGQRQRLGIARALYLNRPVLVLDEATSALDVETEQHVMASLNNLEGAKTIIMISHRLASLSKADQLFDLSSTSPDKASAWGIETST